MKLNGTSRVADTTAAERGVAVGTTLPSGGVELR